MEECFFLHNITTKWRISNQTDHWNILPLFLIEKNGLVLNLLIWYYRCVTLGRCKTDAVSVQKFRTELSVELELLSTWTDSVPKFESLKFFRDSSSSPDLQRAASKLVDLTLFILSWSVFGIKMFVRLLVHLKLFPLFLTFNIPYLQ